MEPSYHRFTELFAQLGLPVDVAGIRQFIAQHSPLEAGVKLEEASFWSSAQATMLREEILLDADWAEVVDQLNAALRNH
ncbi:MAG: DUF2789 domain-containing protein [Pseudomonas sp.]|jgi:hypothetical protein|uniref:DUF2789 domain-containing protein n=1 Tax=Pseudomonas sp. TaxID=306 RepID=UPI001D3DFA4C|nr:DUF2789 domain-containing protein [Pseudomonas sp.]